MGPNNQQKKAKTGSRLSDKRRFYFQNRCAGDQLQGSSFLSKESKDMIADVLHHAATGGAVKVEEKHFDPNNGRSVITLKRNTKLSSVEVAQLIFEKLGFPPDVVANFLVEMVTSASVVTESPPSSTSSLTSFTAFMNSNVGSVLEAIGGKENRYGYFFYNSCWDLFAMILWGTIGDKQTQDINAEEVEYEAVQEELEQVELIFGDNFIRETLQEGKNEDESYRDLLYSFPSADDVQVFVTFRVGEYYPKDPPLVMIDIKTPFYDDNEAKGNGKKMSCSSSDGINMSSFYLRHDVRREILDSVVNTIQSCLGECCLVQLIGSIQGLISGVTTSAPTSATLSRKAVEEAEQNALRNEEAKKKKKEADEKVKFMEALKREKERRDQQSEMENSSNSAAYVARKNRADALPLSSYKYELNDSEDTPEYLLPSKTELETPDVAEVISRSAGLGKTGGRENKRHLRRDPQIDSSLKEGWERLKEKGSLMGVRNKLPAMLERDKIRKALQEHNVVVVSGETGSGKTTQVPQFLYEYCCEAGTASLCNIVCTQPRRLAATAVALRVADERDEVIGQTVGYSIRLENRTSPETKILYCTTGIMLRRLQTDRVLEGVSHIVVDEIHERGVDTDFLLILLKDLLQKRPNNLKVILMSATMNSKLFSEYFYDSPVITISGRTHPVDIFPLEKVIPTVKYVLEDGSQYAIDSSKHQQHRKGINGTSTKRNTNKHLTMIGYELQDVQYDLVEEDKMRPYLALGGVDVRTASTLCRMDPEVINYELVEAIVNYICTEFKDIDGAILIFMPGLAEITKCIEQLKMNSMLFRLCVFYNLHSSLGSEEQRSVFKRPKRGTRKVIIGTNIMETSITIDDAVFVIDSGKVKENRYDSRKSLAQLVLCDISKANARQRAGRAGRVRPGFCFQLFSTIHYEKLEEHQLCEMHRVPLEALVLQIYTLNLGDEMKFLSKALSPPEKKAVEASVKVLTGMGALTLQTKRLTSLGLHLANLPIDVRMGKMVIHGALLACLDPVLTIAACLAVKSPFIQSFEDRNQISAMQKAFAGQFMSDQLATWHAYQRWASILMRPVSEGGGEGNAKLFCQKSWLSMNTLHQIQMTKKQYEWFLLDAGFISASHLEKAGQPQLKNTNKFIFPPYRTLDENIAFEAGGITLNSNSQDVKCIIACLVAGLYPNVARMNSNSPSRPQQRQNSFYKGQNNNCGNCHTKGAKLTTLDGSVVEIHPSSVLGKETSLSQPFVCYIDKIKTSAIYLREVSCITPFQLILFGSVVVRYLDSYQELIVDNVLSFRCTPEEALLLTHIKDQFSNALMEKINDPTVSWETVSSTVVKAILKLLKNEGSASKAMVVLDSSERKALTDNLLKSSGGTCGIGVCETKRGTSSTTATINDTVNFCDKRTHKTCFNCGEVGHLTRQCPNYNALKERGISSVKCFICGVYHHPAQCKICKGT